MTLNERSPQMQEETMIDRNELEQALADLALLAGLRIRAETDNWNEDVQGMLARMEKRTRAWLDWPTDSDVEAAFAAANKFGIIVSWEGIRAALLAAVRRD